MKKINRRNFIGNSVRGAAGISMGMSMLSSTTGRVLGANERIQVALVGCGGRGGLVMRQMV